MAIQKIINFQNCATAIEEVQDPNTGDVVGRVFIVIDNDNDVIYRCVMPVDIAQQQGQRLMGIGNVAVANGKALAQEIARHERPPKS